MFFSFVQRRVQSFYLNYAYQPSSQYCEFKKEGSNVVLFGGGLGKLQGGIKEEEYFSSVNQGLMNKIREDSSLRSVNYLQNWDEYQKTLDHDALYNTCCMNKHKNCKEEAFFMTETAECVKILHDRARAKADIAIGKLTESCDAVDSSDCTYGCNEFDEFNDAAAESK